MTTEVFAPPAPYTIAGTGPYALPFPYDAGAVTAAVLQDGARIVLAAGSDFSVSPGDSDSAGDLFLDAGVAAAHAGARLAIARETEAQQGWEGDGSRERGLEAQMDLTTRAVQELRQAQGQSLRADTELPPFVPVPGGVLGFDPLTGAPRSDVASLADVAAAGGHAAAAIAAQGLAEAARDKAADWAEGGGTPGGPGTKSAKTHAGLAADYALASGPFANRTAAQAAIVPGDVDLIRVRAGDLLLEYLRDPGGTAMQTADGANWSPARDIARPAHFGAAGLTDDTSKLRAMHEWANATQTPVSYAGLSAIRLDADAKIPVNTDVDFAGVPIYLSNGVRNLTDPWNPCVTFKVADPACPLETGSLAGVASVDLEAGSRFPGRGVVDGSGYLRVISTAAMPPRSPGGDPLDYRQPFEIVDGEATTGLCRDLSAETNTYEFRSAASPHITLRGIRLVDDGWNSLVFAEVRRCNVTVEGVQTLTTPGRATDSLDALFRTWSASNVILRDFQLPPRPSAGAGGTYAINFNGAANVRLEGVREQLTRADTWGLTGSNYLSGAVVDGCLLSRFDVHAMGFNIEVRNSTLLRGGLQVGSGGGTFAVRNCTTHQSAIQGKTDYGNAYFAPTIIVEGIRWLAETNGYLVNFQGTQAFRPDVEMWVPDLYIADVAALGTGVNTLLYLGVAAGPAPLRAPATISVSNIRSPSHGSISNTLRMRVMADAFEASGRVAGEKTTHIILDGVQQGNPGAWNSGQPSGLYFPASGLTVSEKQAFRVMIDGCFAIGAHLENGSLTQVNVFSSVIPFLHVGDLTADIMVAASRLGGDSSTSGIRFGGKRASATNCTKIFGCHALRAIDLSDAGSIAGSQVLAATLPAGCSPSDALAGWSYYQALVLTPSDLPDRDGQIATDGTDAYVSVSGTWKKVS